MQLDLLREPLAIFRKSLPKILWRGRFASLLSQQELSINQFKCAFGIGSKGGAALQILFCRHAFAGQPALALVNPQYSRELPWRQVAGLGEELANVWTLPLLPQPPQLAGWVLGRLQCRIGGLAHRLLRQGSIRATLRLIPSRPF
jgi:hypothetical protein